MISKNMVEKIISCNDLYHSDEAGTKNDLLKTMEALSKDELFDLCALMICGREKPETCMMIDFEKERSSFLEGHIEEKQNHLANYLAQKSQKLSQYLRSSLHLLEAGEYKF